MSLSARILACVAAMALAAPAVAQTAASYPRSRALPDVAAWLSSDTPLQLSQVVDVGPSAITAVTMATPTGQPRGFQASIAAEALDPTISRQEEIVSWTIPVEIDCERRSVRLGDMTGYRARDLKTAPRVVRAADGTWVTPSSSAPLGAVVRAMCDRDFKRPFAGMKRVAAKTPEARPGPPPTVVNLQPPKGETPLAAAVAANKPASPPPAAAAPVKHGDSPFVVQVGASPSQDDAQGLLGRVQKRFSAALAGLKADVVSAQVAGKTVYRAQITGFAGAGSASALCEQLKAGGQACFVRR
ncbi:MAG: SPOR domain-containing protein [Phenylobacterium sp.]